MARDDGVPKLGRKGLAWLRRKIVMRLFVPLPYGCFLQREGESLRWDTCALDTLLEHYMANPLRFVTWEDADEFRGPDYACGVWRLNENVALDFPKIKILVDQQLDAIRFETLDAWLDADRRGHLYYSGHPGGMPAVDPALCAPAKKRKTRKRSRVKSRRPHST